jgi:hypothetical protein
VIDRGPHKTTLFQIIVEGGYKRRTHFCNGLSRQCVLGPLLKPGSIWMGTDLCQCIGAVLIWEDRLCGLVVSVEDYKHRGPGSIPGHFLGFFWGSWVWNEVHSASWSDRLSSYLNKEVTVRFGKLKMQVRVSMCWPHVNPVPSGAVGKDCQRRLLSRPRFFRACSATDLDFWI